MPQTRMNRFGVSFLSKANQEEALNEELMSKKELGMTYIKSPTGYIISFDKLAREKSHIDSAMNMALNLDVKGRMFFIDFPDKDLPAIIEKDTNLITNEEGIVITESEVDMIENVYISLDIEALNLEKEAVLSNYPPEISCLMQKVKDGNVIEEYRVDRISIENFNTHVWDFAKLSTDGDIILKELLIHDSSELPEDISVSYVFYSTISVIKRRWI